MEQSSIPDHDMGQGKQTEAKTARDTPSTVALSRSQASPDNNGDEFSNTFVYDTRQGAGTENSRGDTRKQNDSFSSVPNNDLQAGEEGKIKADTVQKIPSTTDPSRFEPQASPNDSNGDFSDSFAEPQTSPSDSDGNFSDPFADMKQEAETENEVEDSSKHTGDISTDSNPKDDLCQEKEETDVKESHGTPTAEATFRFQPAASLSDDDYLSPLESDIKQEAETALAMDNNINSRDSKSDERNQNHNFSSDPNNDPSVVFVDHFSLGAPSSLVRFRNGTSENNNETTTVRLYGQEGDSDQFILEDQQVYKINDNDQKNKQHIITVKRIRNGTFGLHFLRAIYTLASLLVMGFLFVFCFQTVLFLFLNMLENAEMEDSQNIQKDTSALIGAIFSIPLFLYGMSSIMAIAGTFVVDTWKGHTLLRNMMASSYSGVITEWLCFVVFLGLPSFTMAVSLLARVENWWEVTALVFVTSICLFMAVFAAAVLYCEVTACFKIVTLYYTSKDDVETDNTNTWTRWVTLAKKAILVTQTNFYSGVRKELSLVNPDDEEKASGRSDREKGCDLTATSASKTMIKTSTSLYSRLTELSCCRMFEKLTPPKLIYSVDEIRDVMPFVTAQNWSLERICCRNPNTRMVFVMDSHTHEESKNHHNSQDEGKDNEDLHYNTNSAALQSNQVTSSMACTILATVLIPLIVAGFIVWCELPVLLVVLLPFLVVICCLWPILSSFWRVYSPYYGRHSRRDQHNSNSYNNITTSTSDISSGDTMVFQVWETVRITQPSPRFCWTMFGFEVFFLFLWPLISLYVHGNVPVANVFLIVGGFSCIRLYLNASAMLLEMGSLSEIHVAPANDNRRKMEKAGDGTSVGGEEEASILRKKARISEIVGRISRGRSVTRWMWVFGTLIIIFLLAFLAAFQSENFDYKVKGVTLAEGFYYPTQPQLPYPTCQVVKGFTMPGQESSHMADWAYLAALAYAGPSEATGLLDTWFGEGKVVDEYEFVGQYRKQTNTELGVSYKFFTFPDYPGGGVVSIRGSEKTIDWIVDAQLWSAAAVAQLVRAFTPVGWIWTPILDELVYLANSVENASLKKVSYYRSTTRFVNDLLSGVYLGGFYDTIRVTGASLGGGLAIITGAQTNASTIAISGPNAMLSRRTFDPPITKDQLNTHVFNVVPDRDIIARIDDRGDLYQKIQCRSAANKPFECHSMWRTVCEFLFQCGSAGRPVLCWCVTKYGYPEPKQNGTQTWREACASDYKDE